MASAFVMPSGHSISRRVRQTCGEKRRKPATTLLKALAPAPLQMMRMSSNSSEETNAGQCRDDEVKAGAEAN